MTLAIYNMAHVIMKEKSQVTCLPTVGGCQMYIIK